MRKAAGILLIVIGMVLLGTFVSIGGYSTSFDVFIIIANVFIATGGVFCLMRKVWGLCFASALLTLLIVIVFLVGLGSPQTWLTWLMSIAGTLPIIFVSAGKRQWQESQA